MNGVDPSTMETIMLPVAYDKTDPNRVVAAEPQAGDALEGDPHGRDHPGVGEEVTRDRRDVVHFVTA